MTENLPTTTQAGNAIMHTRNHSHLITIVGFIILGWIGTAFSQTGSTTSTFDGSAFWPQGPATIDDIHRICDSIGSEQEPCLLAAMKELGAPAEAIRFAASIDGMGFMRRHATCGRVGIAYVDYPLRANENHGAILLPAASRAIDVDDASLLPQRALKRQATYQRLRRKYPDIIIMPGNRVGQDWLIATRTRSKGVTITVPYRLLNGCHACAEVGSMLLRFSFDRNGRHRGCSIVRVTAAKHRVALGKPELPEETDPGSPLVIMHNEDFSIRLAANPTTGFTWSLDSTRSTGTIRFLESTMETPGPRAVGAGGFEVWTFRALKPGRARLLFRYARSWEKDVAPARTLEFDVQVQ